jgi:translation initiation factor IF-2
VVLTIIYGKEKESETRGTANLRCRIERLKESASGAAARQDKQWLVEGLEEDRAKWSQAWKDHLETMRPPSQAELNACFVRKGKAWRAALRQAASLDQRMEKKMRLYWDMQAKDRERIVRQYEEGQLKATPEEVAAEAEAKGFIARFMGLIREMEAKLKAAEEARRAEAEAEAETAAELTEEASASTDDDTAEYNITTSNDGQKPADEPAEAPAESSAETPVEVTEQSGAMIENKGAASENKAETEPGPVE